MSDKNVYRLAQHALQFYDRVDKKARYSVQAEVRQAAWHTMKSYASIHSSALRAHILRQLSPGVRRELEKHGKPAMDELCKYLSNFCKEKWLVAEPAPAPAKKSLKPRSHVTLTPLPAASRAVDLLTEIRNLLKTLVNRGN